MKSKWNEKSAADKIMLVLRIVISVVVLVSASLKLLNVWDNALIVAIPLLSVLILIQSIQEHRNHKKTSAIIGYICVVIMVVMCIGSISYYIQPDGSTLESREEICAEFPRGKEWKIAIEQELNDYIISGIYSRDGMSGIAVFEPYGNGKYKLQSREWREQDRIVITGIIIDQKWHDIVWFNGAKTDYAEITYTYDGKKQEPIIHNAKGMEIFINPAPAKDYSIDVVYYDSEGNKYE